MALSRCRDGTTGKRWLELDPVELPVQDCKGPCMRKAGKNSVCYPHMRKALSDAGCPSVYVFLLLVN